MDAIRNLNDTLRYIWMSAIGISVLGVILGGALIFWPSFILTCLIYAIALSIIVVSILQLARSINCAKISPIWWVQTILSIGGISLGLYIIANPVLLKGMIGVSVAIFILMQAVFELIASAYCIDKDRNHLMLLGITSVIVGFAALFMPQLTASTIIWLAGGYILIHSILSIYYLVTLYHIVGSAAQTTREANAIEAVVKPIKTKRAGRKC